MARPADLPAPALHILILAAGASSRMLGRDKLLEQVDGTALLRRTATAALATGCPVWVALPPDRPDRGAVLAGLSVRPIMVPDAQTGLSASIRAGLAAIAPDAAILMLLADLPEIDAADLGTMIAAQRAHPGDILRATSALGQPGHPVVFPPWSRPDLADLAGDEGARALLHRHRAIIRTIALPGDHAITDLDTPQDWAAWRARTGR